MAWENYSGGTGKIIGGVGSALLLCNAWRRPRGLRDSGYDRFLLAYELGQQLISPFKVRYCSLYLSYISATIQFKWFVHLRLQLVL